jgi:pyroglutamyl-peptidase
MKRRILVTGFDPFDADTVNASWEAVAALPDHIGEIELCKLQIPTLFSLAAELVITQAQAQKVQAIVCVGQASQRTAVTPERIGINLRHARIPDNQGFQPVNQPIIPGGPDGLFSTMDVEAMAQAIRDAGSPAHVSNTAGTFVCNEVLYRLLYYYRSTPVRVGFVHVPPLTSQRETGMAREKITAALAAALCRAFDG